MAIELPAAVTNSSSTMSPSPFISSVGKPGPLPVNAVVIVPAPNIKSFAELVVAAPLSARTELPEFPTDVSNGWAMSKPVILHDADALNPSVLIESDGNRVRSGSYILGVINSCETLPCCEAVGGGTGVDSVPAASA